MPRIAILLRRGSPPDITCEISERIVQAVDGIAILAIMRQLRNMLKEQHEIMSPLITNCDSSSSVIFVSNGVWICTTSDYSLPRSIHRMSCQSMYCFATCKIFSSQATARQRYPLAQTLRDNINCIPAITLAMPFDLSARGLADWPQCDQSAKTLACNVFGLFG